MVKNSEYLYYKEFQYGGVLPFAIRRPSKYLNSRRRATAVQSRKNYIAVIINNVIWPLEIFGHNIMGNYNIISPCPKWRNGSYILFYNFFAIASFTTLFGNEEDQKRCNHNEAEW